MSLECEKAASAHEKHWRKKNFPSIQSVSSQDKRCSACGECVLLVADHCFINRIVGTIQCRPCHDHFEAVEPWKTSTSQSLCIICGYEKIDRYQCAKNDCSYAVCKSCVVRNSPGSMIDIEKQEWTCFVCCITQLYRSRAIAAVVMTKLAEQSKKDQSEMAEAPKNQTLKQVLTVSDSDASSEPVVLISKIQTKRPKKSSVEPSTSHASSTMRSTRAQTRTTARVRVSSASSSSASESDKKTLQRKARTRALDKIRKASQKQKLSSKRKVPIVKPIEKLNRQNSNSGSEKEFSKHKIIESYVPLKRLRDLEKDYTLPVEDKPVEITENLTQHVAFHLKNIIRNFCKDLKLEGKQMINEAEKIEKNYNYASQLTISDSVLAIMDCKKVRDDIITSQTNGNKKLDDQYDKWCKKASIKNIFSSDEVTESKESVAGPSRKLTTVEEQNEKSSGSDTKTTKVNTKPTEVNGIKSLDTDSDSDSTIRVSINEEPKSLLRNTSTPISDAPPIPEKSNNSHSVSRTPVDMFSDEPESKSASKKRGTSSSESEFELPPRPHTPSRNDSSDQSVATVILDLNSESTAKDLSEMVRTLSPIAPVDNLDSTGSVVESSFNKDDEQLPAPKVTPSRAKDDPARKPASDSSSDTDIECAPRIGSQAAVLTLTSGSDSGKDDAAPLVTVKSVEKINSSLSQSEKTKPRDASPPPASKNDETHEKAVDAEQKNERTPTSKPVVVENIAVGKEAAVNFSESNSGLPLAEKDAGTPGAAADTVVQPSETMETDEPISSDPVQPHSVPQIPENLGTVDGGVLLNGVSDIMEQKKAAKARLLNESSDSEQSGCDSPAATDIEENVVINNSRASANRESSPEPGENSRASANRESSPEPGEIVNSTEVFRPKINRESGEKETEDIATSVPKSSPKKSRKNGVDLAALEKQDMEARAKKSLLATSSESESERPSRVSSPSVDDNDNLKKSHKNTHQTDSDTRSTEKSSEIKYFRFDKRNNKYYRSDSKLRAKCRVKLETLPQRILAQHENILRRQKDYREYREIQSLVSIENLEASKKRHQDGNSSTDGENSPKIRHKKKKSRVEDDEDLLDHLKKVTDGNMSEAAEGEGVQSDDNDNEKSQTPRNNSQDVMLAGDSLMKASLLASSDSEKENPPQEEEEEEDAGEDVSSKNTTTPASKKSTPQKADSENETVSQKKSKSNWRRHKLLTATLSSTDSEAEDEKIGQRLSQREAKVNSDSDVIISDSSPTKQKKIRPRRRRLTSDTDSPIQLSDSDSDAGVFQKKEPIKVDKQIRKRRATSDLSDDSSSSREIVKTKTRKRIKVHKDSDESSGDDDPNQSQSKGRKNIRKVIKDKQVAEDTKAAARDEEERLKRIAERQKVYNAIHEMRIASEEKVEKLVLDFDETTKEPILSVDEALVKKLKPHQAQGIKFMWNACFESVERAKTTSGTGCILAHCMGLGKSFQVVTLAFTLLINYELTGVHKILIVAPLSTVLNWKNEFKMWLSEVKNGDDIEIYEMTKAKSIHERRYILEYWQKSGGVMIMGYEMYRNLTNVAVANQKKEKKKDNAKAKKVFNTALVDPGPDLVICDEGHLLKNEESAISKAMKRVSTLRRIVLTGTPLQNNLREYHCMVQFVKPNLLGSKKEFFNRFVNPIQNGQFDDSTEYDVKIMKKRAHVLHKMLEGSVQRFDYSVLTPFLPPKQEYVILVKLTSVQQKMYLHYLENHTRLHKGGGGSLFADFQALQRIWTHPIVVKQQAEARAKLVQKKREEDSDSEGSIKDFIDDGSLSSNSSSSGTDASSNTSGSTKAKKPGPPKRSTRANPVEPSKDEGPEAEEESEPLWWPQFVSESDYDDMRVSGKLILLFDIIKECEAIGDKILIFSQSLYSLTLIEKFLAMIDEETQNNSLSDNLDKHSGRWVLGQDYFRIDGQTSSDNRSIWVKSFNRPSNTQARLFLISTRAGGLGINLTAANRVVIFDASWNPSHDVQSIFRIYRFGQKKPCYVYRLLAAGTMEEKIYNRQVTKLSLSCRVVDEQQIERHFSNNDLAELYRFDPPKDPAPTLPLPKDRMWADILLRHRDLVETYLEHDSLLENIAEEMLDEEERKQAWLEYEEEKAGKRPPPVLYNQQQLQMQQQAMQFANDMMQQIPMSNFDLTKLTPGLPGLMQAYEQMATNPALSMNMQNYSFTDFNQSVLVPNPLHGNKSAQAAMLQQLPQQRVSLSNMTAQQQVAYAQKFGNNLPSVTIRPAAPRPNPVPRTVDISEDEVVEIPAPSRTAAQVGAGKRQEE